MNYGPEPEAGKAQTGSNDGGDNGGNANTGGNGGSGNGGGDPNQIAFAEPRQRRSLTEIRIFNARETPISEILEQTAAAIIKAGRPVFNRGGQLVEPIWQVHRTNDNPPRTIKQVALVPINVNRMINILTKWVCVYYAIEGYGRNRRLEPIDPPRDTVGTMLDLMHWKLPTCTGITNCPTMRPDGSLLTMQGLDKETGLYAFWPDDLVLPPMPERPTKSDAKEGLELLLELIKECAFAKDVDRAVALAAMLTVVTRGAFPLAPLFFFHKPEPGTGGSHLVKIISTIALGHEAVPLMVSEDAKEFNKELSAAACQAKAILNINNLTFDLESALLSQMLSEGQIAIRPFGRNTETITANCRAMTTLVNGNNIKIVGELVRRALTCRLNTKMERPETKRYEGTGPRAPLALIMRDRAKYITAVFNIVRAYLASGETVNVEPLNGYEAWSELVQKPLVWAGIVDPVTSQKDARERDPERSSLRQRVLTVKKYFHGEDSFTANEISNAITQQADRHQDLLNAFSRDGKPLNTISIGIQLGRDEDRVVDGFSIQVRRATSGHSKGYCVMPRPTKEEPL